MTKCIYRFFCLIAIFGLLEGHLVVLQTCAWVGMLQDRVPERGIVEAVESTFDGSEPCKHCIEVDQERQKKKQEVPIPESDPALKYYTVASSPSSIYPPASGLYIPRFLQGAYVLAGRSDAPPIPPPQV